MVALALAERWLERKGALAAGRFVGEPWPRLSVGIIDGEPRLDLCYAEDARAEWT